MKSDAESLIVFYDDSCPLCRWEIGMYRRLDPLAPIEWRDVSSTPAQLPAGLDQAKAMRRFHVAVPGQLYSGARAFVELWRRLPGWRWVAGIFRVPGTVLLLEGVYRLFLKVRPLMQRGACRLARSDGGG